MSYTGYKSQPLDFMVYKDGPQGKSVESSTRYYTLSKDKPDTPTTGPDVLQKTDQFKETKADGTEVTWSKTPPIYSDEARDAGLSYYESTITVYDNESWQWSEPVKQTVLDVDFIKSIAVTTDQLYALEAKVNDINVVDTSGQTIFRANGLEHKVDVGGFNVVSNKLSAGYGSGAIALQTSSDSREYVDAEYIIADGRQYIDTGLVFDFTTDKIEITVKNTKPNPTGNDGQMIVGAWPPSNGDDNGYAAILYMYGHSSIRFYGLGADGEQKSINTNIVYNDLNKHTYVLDSINNTLIVDTTPQTINFKINELKKVASNKTTYICAGNNSNPNWFWHGQVYGCKIWRNGNLVRLYKPVFKGGVFGLYDVVNSTFHPSASGNNFNGKIVETSASILTKNGKAYQRLDYIQNNSKNNYIDTGIYLDYSKGFSIEATFAITGTTTNTSRGCIASNYLGPEDKGHISIEIVDNQSRFYAQHGDFDDRQTLTISEKTKSIYSYNNKVISHSVVSYDNTTAVKDFSSAGQMDNSLLIFIDQQKRFDPNDFRVPVKLYEMEIYSGGTLIAHFLPFLEVSSNKPGLLNLVNGQFLSQKEGDNFEYQALTAGYTFNDTENNTYRIVEYIESCNVIETNTTNAQGESVISYVQNGNYQRINTELPAKHITAIEVDCENLTPYSVYGALPGYNYTANNEYPGGYFYYGDGTNKQGGITQNKRMIIRQDETRCYRDGTLVYTYPTDLRLDTFTEGPLYLFARYQNGNVSDAGNCRIYYFKAWSGSELVSNFIPVLKNETEYGFYDTAKNKFFGNSGSGQLLGKNFANEDFAAIYIGADSPELAPFSVSNTGKLMASSGNIAGFNIAGDNLWSTSINAGAYLGPATTDSFKLNNLSSGDSIQLLNQQRTIIATGEWDTSGKFNPQAMLHGGDVVCENIIGTIVKTRRSESEYFSVNTQFSCGKVTISNDDKNDNFIKCGGLKSNLRLQGATDESLGDSENSIILNYQGNKTLSRFKLSLSGRKLTLNFQQKTGSGSWTNASCLDNGTLTIYYSTKGWGWPIVFGKYTNTSKAISISNMTSAGKSFEADGNGDVYDYYIYDPLNSSAHSASMDWITDRASIANNIGITGNLLPTVGADSSDPDTVGYNLGGSGNSWRVCYARAHSTNSDKRIKKDINYDLSIYDDFFDSLKPATYRFINNTNNRVHAGFIAQELEQSLLDNSLSRRDLAILDIGGDGFDAKSDTITDVNNTNYFVRYDQFHALNVYQIQKLKKRVSEQENTIKLLEDRIKALEDKIK